MATPLSPAGFNSLNANSPAPMQSTLSKLKTMEPHVPSNADEDDMVWDEGPSSPFVTEIPEDQENANMSSTRSPTAMTEDEILRFDDEVATPISTPQTPFIVAEDETSTFHTVKSSVQSSVRLSPVKLSIARSSSYTSHYEETTSSTRLVSENEPPQRRRIEEADLLDVTTLSVDDSHMDDTCFSTFSQVPNTDMTAFARLGQKSPTKQFVLDQVS
jgi:hypothetical protein